MELSQAGSHNPNRHCVSPMLWRTGLGSNSLTGSRGEAPGGERSTLTIAACDLCRTQPGRDWGARLKFLPVMEPRTWLEILLGKGGVNVPNSREAAKLPLKGTEGAVRSTADYWILNQPPPPRRS